MTTLCAEDLYRDQSTPAPEPIELRAKWMMGAYSEWERWLIWRDGNTEYPVCRIPDIDLSETERTPK
jgi:hypothetical protein